MPLVLADRVRETTTTTGTGTISLAGPVSGFQGFSTAIGNANTTYYTIVDAATGAWEVGLGTYTSSGSTLARTTVLSSSNSDALVPFASGTKDVFVTQPAERAVYILGAGTGLAAGAAAFTANGVPYASATNTLTTGSALTFDGTNLQVGGNSQPIIRAVSSSTNNATARLFTDGDTVYVGSANTSTTGGSVPVVFQIGGSEQMRLTSTGLGIGTSSPGFKLDVGGQDGTNIALRSTGTTAAKLRAYVNGAEAAVIGFLNGGGQYFEVAGSEQMRLTSTGLGIGTTNPSQKLVVSNSGAQGLEISPDAVASAPALVAYNRSGGGYVQLSALALQHVWQAGASPTEAMRLTSTGLGIGTSSPGVKLDVQGSVPFARVKDNSTGYLGFRAENNSGNFYFGIDSSAGSFYGSAYARVLYSDGAYPMVFYTNATEKMRLDSSGNLGIGTSSPVAKIDARITSDGNVGYFRRVGGTINPGITVFANETGNTVGFDTVYSTSSPSYKFRVGGSDIMTLDASGNLLVGTTSANTSSDNRIIVTGARAIDAKSTGGATAPTSVFWNNATTGDNIFASFRTETSDTQRGFIDYNRAGGLTRYNTTSDYRAKDIIGPVQDPGAIIDALKVYEGKMKGATQSRPMLVAHEAQEHAPYAVSGEKDAVNEDGTPNYQQMDVSSLVPLLLAELQSLRSRVAQLEGTQP